MSKKKILAIVMCAIFVVATLAACSAPAPEATAPATEAPASGTEEAPAPAEDAPEGEEAPTTEAAYDEHMVFSLNTLDAEKHGGTAKNDFFNEKFNVEFNYIPVSWGDWAEKVRTWIATDDTPDIIRFDGKWEAASEFQNWAQQGAFHAFPSLEEMQTRWPNLAAIREKTYTDDMMGTVDGELYCWFPARNQPEYMDNSNYIVIGYRRDWAKAVGLYKENDVYTWDEIKAMIDAINEQDPGGNGVGNTLGITAETWAFPVSFMLMTGDPEYYKGYFYDKDAGSWTHIMLTDGYKNSVCFYNDLYQNGYIWKDQVVAGGTEGADYFKAGRTGFFLSNWTPGQLGSFIDTMLTNNVIDSADDIGLTTIYSDLKPGTFWYNGIEDFYLMEMLDKDLTDAQVERIMDMWNWLDTEDGFNFRNYGIEGVDFTKAADGSITLNWEKDETGEWVSPYKDHVFNDQYAPQLDNEFQHLASSREDVLAEFDRIGQVLATDPGFHVNRCDTIDMEWFGENYMTYGNFDSDLKAAATEIIATSTDPAADWDAFTASMLPKVQLVIDELNASGITR